MLITTALNSVWLPTLFNAISSIVQHCGLIQTQQCWTISLITLNNLGSKRLFRAVFINACMASWIRHTISGSVCKYFNSSFFGFLPWLILLVWSSLVGGYRKNSHDFRPIVSRISSLYTWQSRKYTRSGILWILPYPSHCDARRLFRTPGRQSLPTLVSKANNIFYAG